MRLILGSLLLCGLSFAADFSQADALFAKRENNVEATHEAMALYAQILTDSQNKAEQSYAMNRLGRLCYYEGELLTPYEDTKKRMAIFSKCQAWAEQVNSAYWKVFSLGLWSNSAGYAAAWWYLDDLKEAISRALIEDATTDDGGIFRILGALYASTPTLAAYDLYDLNQALIYANKALELGQNRLESYAVVAYVLHQMGKDEAGKEYLKTAMENFKPNAEFEAENRVILERMKKSVLDHAAYF
jgi:hypothetical protein